jgi:hypothetical protein
MMSTDDLGTAQGKGRSKFAQKVLSAQKQPPAPTLFLGNLGFETTVDSIRGLLDAHHRPKEKKSESASESADNNNNTSNNNDDATKKDRWIRKIRMGTFEDSGLCKGYCTSFPLLSISSLKNQKKPSLTGKDPQVRFC